MLIVIGVLQALSAVRETQHTTCTHTHTHTSILSFIIFNLTLIGSIPAMIWMLCSLQNSYTEILNPQRQMVLEGGAFKRYLGHEDGALMNGISALMKEAPGNSLAPSTMWGHSEKLPSMNQEEGPHQSMTRLATWSWTSQPLELWEINVCCLEDTQSVVFCYSSLNRLRQSPST